MSSVASSSAQRNIATSPSARQGPSLGSSRAASGAILIESEQLEQFARTFRDRPKRQILEQPREAQVFGDRERSIQRGFLKYDPNRLARLDRISADVETCNFSRTRIGLN